MLIFVIGTGRSGTHWVARILDSHPGIRTTIEHPPIFDLATRAALHPAEREEILPTLCARYREEERRSRPRHHADKSHPVIWYAETLADRFPDARFVAVERNPYGTVASMLRHGGILWWQHDWERYEFPNPFLGVDASNVDDYAGAGPARRAAWRWLSHHRKLEGLRAELGSRLLVLHHETLVDDRRERTSRLWDFLGLPATGDGPPPERASLDAWRDQLSSEQAAAIEEVTGIPAP